MTTTPRCRSCDKASFATEGAATASALRQAKRHGVPFSTYWCEPGRAWHLTSSRDRTVNQVGTVTPAPVVERHIGTGFIAAPPLEQARRYADLELRGQQTPAELAWLHSEPLLWVRALHSTWQQSQTATAKARRKLADGKPLSGQSASNEYLLAKAEFDKKAMSRMRFEQVVQQRISDVRSLLGTQPVNGWVSAGDMADAFIRIAVLIEEGDTAGARGLALYNAERWSRTPGEYGSEAPEVAA